MVFNFIIVLLIGIIIFFSISNTHTIEKIRPFNNQLSISLNSTPIFSLISADSSNDCPPSFIPLKMGVYTGKIASCNCKGKISKGKCGFISSKIFHCITINATDPIDIYKIYGKILCGEIIEGLTYSTIYKNAKGKNCGYIDTSLNEYWIKEDGKCPINDVIINEIEFIDGYSTFNLNEGKFVHFKREKENGIILTNTSFTLSEGTPCINPYEINSNTSIYSLDKALNNYTCQTKIKGYSQDNRYSNIINTSINRKQLYIDNKINVNDIEGYADEYLNANISIYIRGYIPISNQCNFNHSNIAEILSSKLHFVIMVLIRLFATWYIIMLTIIIMKHWTFDIITSFLKCVYFILISPIVILSGGCLMLIKLIHTNESKCFKGDNISIITSEYINKTKKKSLNADIIIFIFSLLITLFQIASIISYKCKVKKQIAKKNKTASFKDTFIEMKQSERSNKIILTQEIDESELQLDEE